MQASLPSWSCHAAMLAVNYATECGLCSHVDCSRPHGPNCVFETACSTSVAVLSEKPDCAMVCNHHCCALTAACMLNGFASEVFAAAADADWTAAQVERALWSEALAKQLLTQASKGTKRKR